MGRRLLDVAVDAIRFRGHTRVSLKSILNALPFYEHMGFRRTGESLHPLQNGETLPCIEMIRQLA